MKLFIRFATLAGCLILPLVAWAEGSFLEPQVPKNRFSISTWNHTLLSDTGVLADYSLDPDWSVAWLHRFADRYSLGRTVSPEPYTTPCHQPCWEKLSNQATGYVNYGGFDAVEVRRRFSHHNTQIMQNTQRMEYYGALGVHRYHGFTMKQEVHGEQVWVNQTIYQDTNYTVEGELPPYQSLSVGAGGRLYLAGSWFTTLGFTYPLAAKFPKYRITSTDPKVTQQELDQQMDGMHRDPWPGSVLVMVLGFSF